MRKKTQEATLEEFDLLLKAVRQNAESLPGIEPFRDALERAYERALANRRIRDAMRHSVQEATQRMNESFAAGKDAAGRVRNIIRGVLGPRSEKLPQFGIKLRGKRSRAIKRPPMGFELPS